ncbi:hypothetical protein FRB94_005381 [Tulasnella sp. JGI-2019a]|nr:hypothetical protein FRB94_005381 [Tulasnella sp. JGI-2019a]KAG9004487.1 hypothetical protein FRB93_010264 [Tulasnella sp. JGI-2019a]
MSLLDNAVALEPKGPSKGLLINRAAPGVTGYFPLTEPSVGSTDFPKDLVQNEHIPKLFTPIKIRNTVFKNRIFVSPMCQYSCAQDGKHTDWHFVHLGAFAVRGVGAITVEATAVVPEGRISPEDSGLWEDGQMGPLKRTVNFAHSQGAHIGIQLAHAGRKASTYAPWVAMDINNHHRINNNSVCSKEENGWPDNVYGPSAIKFSDNYPMPKAMTLEDIEHVKTKFVESVERCKQIGFDFIELHFAHGYLGHSFLSPLSNKRTDQYGGSLENRMRFALEVTELVRKAWGDEKPLFARLSATDWAPEERDAETQKWKSWGIQQTLILSKELVKLGVDLIDTSSGGNFVGQRIPVGPSYQVPFAEAIKGEEITTGAVGLITTPQQAEEILQKGQSDVIFLARELIRHADWPLYAAQELGVTVQPPVQYERAWSRMITKSHKH